MLCPGSPHTQPPVLCTPGLGNSHFLKQGRRGSVGFSFALSTMREVSQPEKGFGGHWSDSGDRLGDHGPSVGTERQWFTMGGGGSAMPTQHASLSTRSEGWGSSAQMGWGQGTHHPGSTCPPAPSTPHQGRGPASPVTAAALRNPTLWIGGAQPDYPCPGPQPQAEATGRGACLTRSPGVPLGPGGPSCPFRPWGADGRRAGGVARGKSQPWALL